MPYIKKCVFKETILSFIHYYQWLIVLAFTICTIKLHRSPNYAATSANVMSCQGCNISVVKFKTGIISIIFSLQISFGATSDKFSDKLLYPSFFRTVPSDKWQVEVIVLLLLEFKWNWVVVVGSEEEYGQRGVQEFSKLAENKSVCVAYQGLIPVYTDPEPAVKTIIDNINETNVGVVVVFSLPEQAEVFFREVSEADNYEMWDSTLDKYYMSRTCYWLIIC